MPTSLHQCGRPGLRSRRSSCSISSCPISPQADYLEVHLLGQHWMAKRAAARCKSDASKRPTTDGIGVVGSGDIGEEAVDATRAIAQVIASAASVGLRRC